MTQTMYFELLKDCGSVDINDKLFFTCLSFVTWQSDRKLSELDKELEAK